MQKAQVVPSIGRSASPFQQGSRGSSGEAMPLLGASGARPAVAFYAGGDDVDVAAAERERRRRKYKSAKEEEEEEAGEGDDDDDDDEETSLLGTRRLRKLEKVDDDDDEDDEETISEDDEGGLRRRKRKGESGDRDDEDDESESRPLARKGGKRSSSSSRRAGGGGGAGGGDGGLPASWESALRMATACVRLHTGKVYCCMYLSISCLLLLIAILVYVSLGWNYQTEPWNVNQVYYVKRNAGIAAGIYAFIIISLGWLLFRDRRFLFRSLYSISSPGSAALVVPVISLRETEMTTSTRYYRNSRD